MSDILMNKLSFWGQGKDVKKILNAITKYNSDGEKIIDFESPVFKIKFLYPHWKSKNWDYLKQERLFKNSFNEHISFFAHRRVLPLGQVQYLSERFPDVIIAHVIGDDHYTYYDDHRYVYKNGKLIYQHMEIDTDMRCQNWESFEILSVIGGKDLMDHLLRKVTINRTMVSLLRELRCNWYS